MSSSPGDPQTKQAILPHERSSLPHGLLSEGDGFEIKIINASGIPDRVHGKVDRSFYVSTIYGAERKYTSKLKSQEQIVQWNETHRGFFCQDGLSLELQLVAERSSHKPMVMGKHIISIDKLHRPASQGMMSSLAELSLELSLEIEYKEIDYMSYLSTHKHTISLRALIIPSTSEIVAKIPPGLPIVTPDPASEVTTPLAAQPAGPLFLESVVNLALESGEPLPVPTPPSHPMESAPAPMIEEPKAAAKSAGKMKSAPDPISKAVDAVDLVSRAADGITTLYGTWQPLLDQVGWIINFVDGIANVHPYAKMAWSVLSIIPRVISEQAGRDDQIRGLRNLMLNVFKTASAAMGTDAEHMPQKSEHVDVTRRMLQQVTNCGDFILSYSKDLSLWKRLVKGVLSRADIITEQYKKALEGLRDEFRGIASQITEICVLGIVKDLKEVSEKVDDLVMAQAIKELPHGSGTWYPTKPLKRCFKGTRTHILQEITDWVNNPTSKRMLVLFGQAGKGKSAIAHQVIRDFRKAHRLTSCFIFVRPSSQHAATYLPLTTLIRDLCDRHPAYKAALWESVQSEESLQLENRDCDSLFDLLVAPFKSLSSIGPMLVIIDALDESGDVRQRRELVNILSHKVHLFPHNFRILITARPEPDLDSAKSFFENDNIQIVRMESAADTKYDIQKYIRSQLEPKVASDKECEQLAEAAGELFQWAFVACDVISIPPSTLSSRACLLMLLDSKHPEPEKLDELYLTVLRSLFSRIKEDLDGRRFRFIMSILLESFTPVSRSFLETVVCASPEAPLSEGESAEDFVNAVVRGMGSLLGAVREDESSLPITFLHTSFREFLTNQERAGDFYVNYPDIHVYLARACFRSLLDPKDGLRFNICCLESSHARNSDVEDLSERIKWYIPPFMLYACHYWDDHLEKVQRTTEFLSYLKKLFKEKLLFWFELLSLTNSTTLAIQALSITQEWLNRRSIDLVSIVSIHAMYLQSLIYVRQHMPSTNVQKLLALVKDATSFLHAFANIMAQSAPHIYLSALPNSPSSSIIWSRYHKIFSGTLSIRQGRPQTWPSLQLTISSCKSPVKSVAFSPQGDRIVSGSDDGTIWVWNAMTGEVLAGPFNGHTDRVCSVAFSPDGNRIVSGSDDETVQVWNAMTGDIIAGPFNGHADTVQSVAFSPDGDRIVSGSEDGTIRVWNATTGDVVVGPFNGHTGSVRSVAFSCDGDRLVSGSDDSTIRVWNATTGKVVAGPFKGHTDWIRSVVFSSDGNRIVSGSDDCTIRVWDAITGKVIAGPFRHTSFVWSVSFSPDGGRIVSGSNDGTIQMWSAMTSKVVAGRFDGHTDTVRSIAFSPHGDRIVSGSSDKTIRVWNATMGEVVAGSFNGHTDSLLSVAFAPEGDRIASGSSDKTIRVWDATTGEVVAGPFKGHTDTVQSVAFSLDGDRIVSGSSDKTILVWNATAGKVVAGPFKGHMGAVWSVAFSPYGERIVSGSGDKTIRVWNATTGEVVLRPFNGHTSSVRSVAFSPDGNRIVSGSDDKTIRVWNAATGDVVVGPLKGHTGGVLSVAFSPDGDRIVSTSDDKTILVWNATTGEVVAGPFIGHTGWVRSVSFSPDGDRIVSGSDDETIRVWNATTGDVVAGPFNNHKGIVWSVAFSPNGSRIVSGSSKSIHVMDVSGRALTARWAPLNEAVIGADGWLTGTGGELLVWVPDGMRDIFPSPSTVFAIGREGVTRVDYSRFFHGLDWTRCYTGTTH